MQKKEQLILDLRWVSKRIRIYHQRGWTEIEDLLDFLDRTIDILENLYPVLSREESLALVEKINKEYAVSSGYAQLNTFNKEQIKSLKEQYVKDIQAIKREFPNINFLKGQNI